MTSKGSEDLFFFLGDLLGATRGSVTHAHPRVPDKHEQVMELRSDLRNDPELRSRLTDHLFHYFGPHRTVRPSSRLVVHNWPSFVIIIIIIIIVLIIIIIAVPVPVTTIICQ